MTGGLPEELGVGVVRAEPFVDVRVVPALRAAGRL